MTDQEKVDALLQELCPSEWARLKSFFHEMHEAQQEGREASHGLWRVPPPLPPIPKRKAKVV